MTKSNGVLPQSFYTIITKAVTKKSYGSIEIYLEAGKVTQITERIINKISHNNQDKKAATATPRTA